MLYLIKRNSSIAKFSSYFGSEGSILSSCSVDSDCYRSCTFLTFETNLWGEVIIKKVWWSIKMQTSQALDMEMRNSQARRSYSNRMVFKEYSYSKLTSECQNSNCICISYDLLFFFPPFLRTNTLQDNTVRMTHEQRPMMNVSLSSKGVYRPYNPCQCNWSLAILTHVLPSKNVSQRIFSYRLGLWQYRRTCKPFWQKFLKLNRNCVWKEWGIGGTLYKWMMLAMGRLSSQF